MTDGKTERPLETIKFKVMKRKIEGYNGIKDLQEGTVYDLISIQTESGERVNIEFLSDNTLNIYTPSEVTFSRYHTNSYRMIPKEKKQ